MLTGLYAAASGLQAQQLRLDALANDIANVSTNGYQRTRVAFRDLFYAGSETIKRGAGVAAVSIGPSLAQGSLGPGTGPLSVAIEGPGFIQVRTSDGTLALTRSGDLRIDAEGNVVLPSGEQVEPKLTIPPGTDLGDVAIAADGAVSVRGEQIGSLTLLDVPSARGLESMGGLIFAPTEYSGPTRPATSARLRQGFIETSSVDMGRALVETIETQRSFEMAARALKMQEQMLELANNLRR